MNAISKYMTWGRDRGGGNGATLLVLLVGTAGLLVTAAALNGGVAPAPSAWDVFKTWLQDLLTSTFVIMLALIALIAALWQVTHGRGYAATGVVLGVLALGYLGPGVVTTIATSTRAEPIAMVDHAIAASRR